mgnify:CR=1 FL=1
MCGIWALIKSNIQLDSSYIESFSKIKNRGPDTSMIIHYSSLIAGFHRLAINDTSIMGNQPFVKSTETSNYILMANGEIYNHKILETEYNIKPKSTSDCDFLLDLFIELKEDFVEFNKKLRGEYAICIFKLDHMTNNIKFWASTDPLSVRPLFCFVDTSKQFNPIIGFSSLLVGLSELSNNVQRLNQGHYMVGSTDFSTYFDYSIEKYIEWSIYSMSDFDSKLIKQTYLINLQKQIVDCLIDAIKIRLKSDRPLGCLLSGGLDSSLVAAIAAKELAKTGQILHTFSIGMTDGTDNKYARIVADYIGSKHTEFIFDEIQGIAHIDDVILATETFDITTIRASVGQ